MLILQVQETTRAIESLDSKIIVAIITAGAAFVATIVSTFLSYINQRKQIKLQDKVYNDQKNALKREKIERLLNEFYKPFNYYLSQSFELYKTFRNGLPREFRALEYFIDNDYKFKTTEGEYVKVTLTESQLKKFDLIIEILDQIVNLIVTKGHLVEDKVLNKSYTPNPSITDVNFDIDKERPTDLRYNTGLLSIFTTHVKYIKLGRQGELDKAEFDTLKNYVYPRELNPIITKSIEELEVKLKVLIER